MEKSEITVVFPTASKAEATRLAASLSDDLNNRVRELQRAGPKRDNKDAQDFGATVVLILGTAAATAVAKGIQAWLSRHGTSAEIHRDGTVVLKNLESKDVAAIAKAISTKGDLHNARTANHS